jgi:hypothetical protein
MTFVDFIVKIGRSAIDDFDDILDYIWKTPRLIESEYESELDKLDDYFPDDGTDKNKRARALRWRLESRKLDNAFPLIMAKSNLFSSASLYEAYMLWLCRHIDKNTGEALQSIKGNGIARLFTYLRQVGVDVRDCADYEQVDAAICIRNCLLHANGQLSWSRERSKLNHIINKKTFLRDGIRDTPHIIGGEEIFYVKVASQEIGDAITIDNMYAHISAAYMRDHFISVCKLSLNIFSSK